MEKEIEFWESKIQKVDMDNQLFLKNHKARLDVLLATDVTQLPEQAQKQHQAKVKYLEIVIETVEGLREIISGMVKTYRNELLTPQQKLNIMAVVNSNLTMLVERLDCQLKN